MAKAITAIMTRVGSLREFCFGRKVGLTRAGKVLVGGPVFLAYLPLAVLLELFLLLFLQETNRKVP